MTLSKNLSHGSGVSPDTCGEGGAYPCGYPRSDVIHKPAADCKLCQNPAEHHPFREPKTERGHLYRVLVEVHTPDGARFMGKRIFPAWSRHDVVVWATDEDHARRLALAEFRGQGDRRRTVPDSIVPVALDHYRVVMQHTVTW